MSTTNQQTWLVTGAASGLGAEIVRAGLRAGHHVVATGRAMAKLESAYSADRTQPALLELDVTKPESVAAAVAAITGSGRRIDVLVNNAAFGVLGVFESISEADVRDQFETNVFGLMEVTRAVLPVMRDQRAGHIVNFSSVAGIRGNTGSTVYAASKFAVEGFSEALAQEVRQFGIGVTIIVPGLFRTGFMSDTSARFGTIRIDDYTEYSETLDEGYKTVGQGQGKDPRGMGQMLVDLLALERPPRRFPAGRDALATVERKVVLLQEDVDTWRELSESLENEPASLP
ncbi:MAG: SDR family oxidoreductase [Hyphomicrobiales bacterium]|jgi:short-subunit dehydrogenase|nr:MAG: SDR family oxidoreductase [Hyphomicrobiales bacterium]